MRRELEAVRHCENSALLPGRRDADGNAADDELREHLGVVLSGLVERLVHAEGVLHVLPLRRRVVQRGQPVELARRDGVGIVGGKVAHRVAGNLDVVAVNAARDAVNLDFELRRVV